LITSISGGFNIDLFSYLFGNILTIKTEDILFTFILTLIVLITIYYFLDEFLSTAFDEELAKVSGINTKRLNAILIIITALTIVLSMRVVGILLVSSFLILPNVSALQIAKNFKRALIFSNLISIFCLLSGIIFSFAFNIPAGATIVLLNVIFLILTLILKKFFF
ncbi:MAG: metal ABC transporter permease, partial [Proteobacteria bacterium]|nr:metal ABC transporter permease [Pseudomonadota bacterium]